MTLLLATALLAPWTSTKVKVNRDWLFHREEASVSAQVPSMPYDGSDWETVNLPHTARLEDDTKPEFHSFLGVVWYRKTFKPSEDWRGHRVVLDFEGAMQATDIWVDGEHRLRHTGGYLPFTLDLSQDAQKNHPITVEVRLDNRPDPSFPPGKPQDQLDFTYAGGLYRNVWLEVTPKTHLSNVFVYATKVAAGGADVRVEVSAETILPESAVVSTQIFDPSGRPVQPTIAGLSGEIHLTKPVRWDLDNPQLYRAVTSVAIGGEKQQLTTRFGVRDLQFDHSRGAFLNGKPLQLQGSNRHMAFPIIGNAASDEAQYREAKLLKSQGLNILRLSHYPQSPAFLDACDELGLLVIDPIPGWQYFNNTKVFRDHVLQDVRQMVVRDRNHPCVAIFETCLNETYGAPDDFWRECSGVAHDNFGLANFFTGGDAVGKHDLSKPLWDVPWTGWEDDSFTRPALFPMQKGVDREYGDYEFGGEQSTSRVARGEGEGALLLQAWNFIWSHNRNRGNSWSFGDLTWEAIDTYRGMNPQSPVSHSGMLDLFRLPKPVAYFYQSQGLTKPMVRIANGWSDRPSPTKVVVFSNCDEVELRLNDKPIARQKPDSGPTTGYIGPKVADPLYWSKGSRQIVPASEANQVVGGKVGALPFSGGNCEFLAHPPFTFTDVAYQSGKLEAVGYRAGKVVTKDAVWTPGKPTTLSIRVETQGKPLRPDGADFVFVYVSVLDSHGQGAPDAKNFIKLQIEGQGEILGASGRLAEAGIAAFMVRSKATPGEIRMRASTAGLRGNSAQVVSR